MLFVATRNNLYIFLVTNYSCFNGYCPSIYGEPIRGNVDTVVTACSLDSKCTTFRHSSKLKIGYLCYNHDAIEQYDDWKLCEFDSGENH